MTTKRKTSMSPEFKRHLTRMLTDKTGGVIKQLFAEVEDSGNGGGVTTLAKRKKRPTKFESELDKLIAKLLMENDNTTTTKGRKNDKRKMSKKQQVATAIRRPRVIVCRELPCV